MQVSWFQRAKGIALNSSTGRLGFVNPSGYRRFIRSFFAVALVTIVTVLAGLPTRASAQVLYGTLTGNVTDPAEAAIPSANVKAVNVATGVVRETTTNGEGIYLFNDLNPGQYQITVSSAGFATVHQGGITVLVNTSQRVNVQLKIGTSDQEVTVSSTSPTLASC